MLNRGPSVLLASNVGASDVKESVDCWADARSGEEGDGSTKISSGRYLTKLMTLLTTYTVLDDGP